MNTRRLSRSSRLVALATLMFTSQLIAAGDPSSNDRSTLAMVVIGTTSVQFVAPEAETALATVDIG